MPVHTVPRFTLDRLLPRPAAGASVLLSATSTWLHVPTAGPDPRGWGADRFAVSGWAVANDTSWCDLGPGATTDDNPARSPLSYPLRLVCVCC